MSRPGSVSHAVLASTGGEYEEIDMFCWAKGSFGIAILAAMFGFGCIPSGAEDLAKAIFFLFLVVFLVSGILVMVNRSRVGSRP